MYGVAPDPGVGYRYHRLVCGDWWDEDPSTVDYNRFVHVACGTRPAFGGGSEALWLETRAYVHFAVIAYNAGPIVPGRGSAIFLHADVGAPTNGCVSLPLPRLDAVLRALRPGDAPLVVIGTASSIRRY
jgi:L,D-peptidoglycan transpeptidase YkuD (ErfK/YbiS/YcfS/YnhG family)